MRLSGESFGVVGALSALPLRLAARQLQDRGARMHRGMTRKTTRIVVGRTLLARYDEAEIERRLAPAEATGLPLISENGFLRALGTLPDAGQSNLSRLSLVEQSKLDLRIFDRLALFDAFEHHSEPFSFRDLILARKYAGLVASGAGWAAIARSVHSIGPVGSLTALTLYAEGAERILSRDAHSPAELDGQRLLPLDDGTDDAEDFFGLAEAAEAAGLFGEAATLYRHCVSLDPTDATAAFNEGNCLRVAGDLDGAANAYASALKRDPDFVETWFNYGGLLREQGRIAAARQHLERAVALDAGYADAVYNLAVLEYDTGRLSEARHWWKLYLSLDERSEWARRARAGIALIDRQLRRSAG
jgi:tetratricopeptide (TPR) repeat protein